MRVLWFANTPCLGSHHLNKTYSLNKTGGWLDTLNANIELDLDLGIVFHYPKKISNFRNGSFYKLRTIIVIK